MRKFCLAGLYLLCVGASFFASASLFAGSVQIGLDGTPLGYGMVIAGFLAVVLISPIEVAPKPVTGRRQ